MGRFSGNNIEGDDYKKQSVMIEVFKSMINEGLAGWRFVIVASLKEDQQLRFEKLREQSEGYPIELVVNPDSKK
ncbi:MAG: hypothetical protein GW925_00140, partial [Candidatus Pacebacteria bacterium]|nr:hypothetical protein [Candidatus Paceibacterota bacterium]